MRTRKPFALVIIGYQLFRTSSSSRVMKINIFGHRGFGASDSPFHSLRDRQMGIRRLPENTLESHRQALLNGAEGVEMDAIETVDGYIVSTHADEVYQHVLLPYDVPEKYIGRMTYDQIRQIPAGVTGQGQIPLLKDLLLMMKTDFPGRMINIELKGKIGNLEDQASTSPTLPQRILHVIQDVEFPFEHVIFSSFALSYLHELDEISRQMNIAVKKGILFTLASKANDPSTKKLLYNRDDFDIPLTNKWLEYALDHVSNVYSIHAEIKSLTPDIMSFLAQNDLALCTWALRELSPLDQSVEGIEFCEAVKRLLAMAKEVNLSEITIITDHVNEMKELLSSIKV